MPQANKGIRINGKVYNYQSFDADRKSLERYGKQQLKPAGYEYRILRITKDTLGFPPDVLRNYKKDFPHGRWGIWVRKRIGEKDQKATKHTYELKFPHEGSRWYTVVSTNSASAKRKFVAGSTYKPSQVKIRFVK